MPLRLSDYTEKVFFADSLCFLKGPKGWLRGKLFQAHTALQVPGALEAQLSEMYSQDILLP